MTHALTYYTAVFSWPAGQEPRICKNDSWLGGDLVTVEFCSNALEERESLRQLLTEASGKMSYGHWSSEFRDRVEKALK